MACTEYFGPTSTIIDRPVNRFNHSWFCISLTFVVVTKLLLINVNWQFKPLWTTEDHFGIIWTSVEYHRPEWPTITKLILNHSWPHLSITLDLCWSGLTVSQHYLDHCEPVLKTLLEDLPCTIIDCFILLFSRFLLV